MTTNDKALLIAIPTFIFIVILALRLLSFEGVFRGQNIYVQTKDGEYYKGKLTSIGLFNIEVYCVPESEWLKKYATTVSISRSDVTIVEKLLN